jgi:hypothetical protein
VDNILAGVIPGLIAAALVAGLFGVEYGVRALWRRFRRRRDDDLDAPTGEVMGRHYIAPFAFLVAGISVILLMMYPPGSPAQMDLADYAVQRPARGARVKARCMVGDTGAVNVYSVELFQGPSPGRENGTTEWAYILTDTDAGPWILKALKAGLSQEFIVEVRPIAEVDHLIDVGLFPEEEHLRPVRKVRSIVTRVIGRAQ